MSNKYYNISDIQSGITENHTLSLQYTIKYIDSLYKELQPYKISQNILHLKLIDPSYDILQPIINDIDGYICELEYLNKTTWDRISNFIKKNFDQSTKIIETITKNLIEPEKYSIFIFIKSNIGYVIPLFIDGNDVKLEFTCDEKNVFISSLFNK
tara:strand:+ start:634 stop:1098 length:465 start_codon:yes stop_codon:yes gene_type:complete